VKTVFVKALFDLDCTWEGLPPVYRIYVEDELFAERTWIWTDSYLTEMLQIQAPPVTYNIRIEPVRPCLANFHLDNFRIAYGPGRWLSKDKIEIQEEKDQDESK
jgi:hypothetical protein